MNLNPDFLYPPLVSIDKENINSSSTPSIIDPKVKACVKRQLEKIEEFDPIDHSYSPQVLHARKLTKGLNKKKIPKKENFDEEKILIPHYLETSLTLDSFVPEDTQNNKIFEKPSLLGVIKKIIKKFFLILKSSLSHHSRQLEFFCSKIQDYNLENIPDLILHFLKNDELKKLSLAKNTHQHQLIEIEDRLLLFTPSGKIYLSLKKLGTGHFKTTLKTALLFPYSTHSQEHFQYRALSLTKKGCFAESKDEREALLNEIKIHFYLKGKAKEYDLSHLHIAKSIFSFQDQVGILTELCEGDVASLLDSHLSLEEGYFLATNMAKAVSQLHAVQIVHRDLKPDNFLFMRDEEAKIKQVKLTDFGLASLLQKDDRYFIKKYPYCYSDPSWLIQDQLTDTQFSKASDIYQLGVTFYQILSGFSMSEFNDYLDQIIYQLKFKEDPLWDSSQNLPLEELKNFLVFFKKFPSEWEGMQNIQDAEVRDFILRMLDKNPCYRPTADEAVLFFKNKHENFQGF